MLDRWLTSLSRRAIAVVAIVTGTFLIVLFNPPHSACDIQKEIFKEEIGKYFFLDSKEKKILTRSRFVTYIDRCRYQNSAGGCYDFLTTLRLLQKQLQGQSQECVQKIGRIKEIEQSLWNGLNLMARIAWGERAPASYMDRNGWLSVADISLFCRVKRQALRIFGQDDWEKYQEGLFRDLPGIAELPRKEAWSRMLISIKCDEFI